MYRQIKQNNLNLQKEINQLQKTVKFGLCSQHKNHKILIASVLQEKIVFLCEKCIANSSHNVRQNIFHGDYYNFLKNLKSSLEKEIKEYQKKLRQKLEQHITKSSENAPYIIHSDNSDSSDEKSYDPEYEYQESIQEDDEYDESYQEVEESPISFENSELDSEFEQKEKRYSLRKRLGQNKQQNERKTQIQNSQIRSQQRTRTRSNQKPQYQVQDKKLQQINDFPKKITQKPQFVNINYKIKGMEEDLAIMQNLKDNSLLKSLKTLFSDGISHGALNLKLPKLFCERLIAYIKSFKLDLYQQAIDEIGVENIHLRDKWWKAQNAQQINFINYACNLRD